MRSVMRYDTTMTQRTLITDLFPLADLEAEVAQGYVTRKSHPTRENLAILNYGPAVQYERRWNDVTKKTRGLIYDTETLEVVSRGFEKFGNWDEAGYPYPPGGNMVMSTKFDGSLGILYDMDSGMGSLAIATRGSFASEQAEHACETLYDELYSAMNMRDDIDLQADLRTLLKAEKTPLFEIIYPENRIVVNYGDEDKLVLLDVLDNRTGKSDIEAFEALAWEHKAEKTYVPGGFSDALVHDIPSGEEGFVLYFPWTGFRCKMKSAEYVELHRIVTGLSKKSIWEAMGRGQTPAQIKANLPDELFEFVDKTVMELRKQQLTVLNQVTDAWFAVAGGRTDAPVMLTRKQFAERAKKHGPLAKYLFKILDGADEAKLREMIWDTLKPVGDTRAFARSEDNA